MRDVIVIGGGPAGSTAATLLARKGFSVLLLERERFPRFQIGESLLPYSNDLFDRLGITDQLRASDFHPKYGATFVTGDGSVFSRFHFDSTLPAQYHQTFQVKRAEFDHILLRNAGAAGVEVREGMTATAVNLDDPAKAVVTTSDGATHDARFLLDATGHAAIIGTRMGERREIPALKKVAFFAHYKNVVRPEGRPAGDTVIVVLKDGWFWMIPVSRDTTSVGLVVDREHVMNCGLTPEQLLDKTIAATPWVLERMGNAERITQVYARKDFSFRMGKTAGPNFALIGDAAGFLDPIFSTGVFIAMKSADIATDAVEQRLRSGSTRLLKRYDRQVASALSKYLRLIESFYCREFLEIFMRPHPRFGLVPVIVGLLAGNVFARRQRRLKLELFFALVAIQKRRKVIADPIAWDSLPAAATV